VKIDIFNHFYPKRFYDQYVNLGASFKDMGKRVQAIGHIADIDQRLRAMDEWPDLRQVLTLPQPPVETLAGPDKTPEMAKIANDGFAELVQKYPDRFIAFGACVPMNNPDATLKEIDRAITQLGAKGIQLYTNISGKPLDAPEFKPVFDEMARRKLPIWLHPTRGADFSDYATEDKSQYEIWWTFGWPYETSAAMARLVFSGLFDRHPDIKIITHHGGGILPQCAGRLRDLPFGPEREDVAARLKAEPLDYFRRFYGDTAQFGNAGGMRCAVDFFGADHILFGTDFGFNPNFASGSIADLEAIGLSDDDLEKIFEGNARRVLRLEARSAAIS
jgi:uncharacterized protein